jgi:L-alanine-DL-glutamate epimerase-like enolase superfamily enzyme
MRVRRVDVIETEGPVEGPLSARARWDSRGGLLLRVEDPDGRVGLGEASPLPFYSPDTLYDASEALRAVDWPAIPEADAGEPALTWLGRIPVAPFGSTSEGRDIPSARFALETALLDLLGQRRGVPIHRLLSEDGSKVPLCFLLGAAADESVIARAEGMAEAFAHTVKLKITGPLLGEQLDVLRRVRDVIGAMPLRLDANRTFSEGDWERELAQLTDVAPELVEEPAQLDGLLRAVPAPVPTALDEALQDPAAWPRLVPALSRLRCVAVVLKPTALGGFAACLGWAARAREQGLDVTVSHTFEGPVGLSAAAHLAIAIASRSRASGLSRHGGLAPWPKIPLPMLEIAHVVAAEAPGLGVASSFFE